MIRMKVTGISKTILGLEAVSAELGRRFQKGLHKAGQYVKTESGKIVPYRTGALYKSRSNRNIGGQGWKAEQVVSYGNDEVDYAIYQHEREDYYHTPPRTHHYLSKVIARQNKIREIVVKEMNKPV